jgi:hypothetical protein
MNATPAMPPVGEHPPAPSERLPRRSLRPVGNITRWVMPSVGSFCLLLILWLLLVNSWRLLQDSDTGWHIRTGDLIRQSGAAPRQDVFSYTMTGREWFAWEWLTDVLMSLAHSRYGLAGIAGATALLLALSYALLFQLMIARRADAFVACALTLLAALASMVHWLARPHVISILLLIGWLFVIESWRRYRHTAAWRASLIFALPPLLALWANLHGAFVVTFPMLLIYAVGETLEFISRREPGSREFRKTLRTYLIVGAMSGVATLATPYGFRLWGHLWRYLNDRELLARIQEFQSPDFHTVDGKLIELLLLLAAIAAARAAFQRRFIDIGLLLFWSHLTLQSERHVTLAVIVMTPIIAEHLSALLRAAAQAAAKGKSRSAQIYRAMLDWYRGIMVIDRQLTGAFVYILTAVFLLTLTSGSWNRLTDALLPSRFDERRLPISAAEFLMSSGVSGHGFAPDQFGGYLIYRFHPQLKVFVDGRSDFYRTGPVFDEYLRVATIRPDWAAILDRYDVRWMLLRSDEPLATVALATGRWTNVYQDSAAQVLLRK